MKKNIIVVLFSISILVFGCNIGGKSSTKSIEDIRVGTEGISLSFLANNPPAIIHVEDSPAADNKFKVVLQLNNKGAYPQTEEGTAPQGKLYLSGYDPKIISELKEKDTSGPWSDLAKKTLEGKSTINPGGGIDFVDFDGKVDINYLNVEKYEPTLLATACYKYNTVLGPQVCIDPDPYSTVNTKKVCTVSEISLSNQGAPIAVTSISEEALATKTQFRITIKNVGSGDVIKSSSIEKCDPFGTEKLSREDYDKVFLEEVKIGAKQLQCGPFSESSSETGFVRLINKEGSIICKLEKSEYAGQAGQANSAYTTPLRIKLSYAYKNTADRKILVKKEGGNLGSSQTGGTGSPIDSGQTPQPPTQGEPPFFT